MLENEVDSSVSYETLGEIGQRFAVLNAATNDPEAQQVATQLEQ
ncbi:MAG: hypothetical protein AAB588_02725 [Patescibacteria group bacterium]